jgi:hypothetical protein
MRTRVSIAAAFATSLSTFAFLPAYADGSWLGPVIGAVVTVFFVAEVARIAGVPGPLSSVVAVAGLACYVTAVFAHGTARAGFLPGGDARHHLHLLTDRGMHDISHLRAPVPTNTGLVLLTVIGLGLLAVLIDVLTGVLRRPALAGLPFLALFAVPAATVPKGVGILPFVAGGIGYLTLLMAESTERVSRWGRPLGMGWNDGRGGRPSVPSGRTPRHSPLWADASALAHWALRSSCLR